MGGMQAAKVICDTDGMKLGSKEHIELTEKWSAHNYHPLDVVIAAAEGAWMTDVEGKRYLDMLSGYSALNFGHGNKRLRAVAHKQLDILHMTSRAFFNDQLGLFCRDLAELVGLDMVLPMTSGAEAVETAIKASRRWGYQKKGVPQNEAQIIVFDRNFAGRTTTIIGFSDSADTKKDFGPFTPGFQIATFGDIKSVEKLITKNTVAVIVEPIQGEGGVNIPSDDFIPALRALASKEKFLLIADEIQTGLCRTGTLLACDHYGVKPDLVTLGKSLGGGITPISALVGKREVMELFTPGSHGSTFGGNPLACAVGREVIALIKEEKPHESAARLGKLGMEKLRAIRSKKIKEIRGKGLMIGIEIYPEFGVAYDYCEKLKTMGVLCKDTRASTMRLAPPLVIEEKDLLWGISQVEAVLKD